MAKRNFDCIFAGTLLCVGLLGPMSAAAESEITLYGWGSNISGEGAVGDRARSFDADFDDLLDKTEFALMGHFESYGDDWGGGVDVSFVELEDTVGGVDTTADFGIYEAFATYRASPNVDLLGGVRYTDLDIEVDPVGVPPRTSNNELVDGFVGARFKAPLGDAWEVSLRADIGAGDSDQVVNAIVALRWLVSPSWVLSAGYRWIDYEFEGDRAGAEFDVTLDGFLVGASYRF